MASHPGLTLLAAYMRVAIATVISVISKLIELVYLLVYSQLIVRSFHSVRILIAEC